MTSCREKITIPEKLKTCNQYLQHFFGCHEDMQVLIFIRIFKFIPFYFVIHHTATFIKSLAIIRRHLLDTAFRQTDISHRYEKCKLR